MSLSTFSGMSLILVKLGFGDVGFCEGRKTREPGEKPSEQGENEEQTQPTYSATPESIRIRTLFPKQISRTFLGLRLIFPRL